MEKWNGTRNWSELVSTGDAVSGSHRFARTNAN